MRNFRRLTFENKTIRNAVIGLCLSAALACGKIAVGILTDYNLISVAVCTFGILLAKSECVLGATTNKLTFGRRNMLTAAFLFMSGIFYTLFMGSMFFVGRRIKNNGLVYVVLLAFISFCELGFAIAGLIRTKNKGHYYRNIKIINLCAAVIAILTTQMAILNLQSDTGEVSIVNAYSGIGAGCFIILCAVYILIAPKTSSIGREHNKFILTDPSLNKLVDMSAPAASIILCKSYIYGDRVFSAKISDGAVEGDIICEKSLWKRMHLLLKILCCILSEILIFVWLAGRGILFLRAVDLPRRLCLLMRANGFEKAPSPEGADI